MRFFFRKLKIYSEVSKKKLGNIVEREKEEEWKTGNGFYLKKADRQEKLIVTSQWHGDNLRRCLPKMRRNLNLEIKNIAQEKLRERKCDNRKNLLRGQRNEKRQKQRKM